MVRKERATSASPTRHTVLIFDPRSMWEKLYWDIVAFQDIQRSYPNEDQPIAYAAINVCVAASSLADWVVAAGVRRARAEGESPNSKTLMRQLIAERVPLQALCEDIANTAKHSEFNERYWRGGQVSLLWEEGDEDGPSGWVLYHADEAGTKVAYSTFEELKDTWWALLMHLDLVPTSKGAPPLPVWYQNKLHRIFPPIDPHDLPPGVILPD